MTPRIWVVWSPPDARLLTDPLLDAAARARCARFRLPLDAARHATGRVLARRTAGDLLGVPAADVHLGTEPSGRPVLLDGRGRRRALHVSITHAGDLVGVALGDVPVGLDVQDVASIAPVVGSDLVYTPAEIAQLRSLDDEARLMTASAWWTAKEAVLKSLGRGLLEPAERLDVRSPTARVRLADGVTTVHWEPVGVPPGHAAALAAADPDALRRRRVTSV